MKPITLGLAGLLALGPLQSVRAGEGLGFGALLGGIAGGVIGHQSKEALAGAAVGVAAGAFAGHLYDHNRERRETVVVQRYPETGYHYSRRERVVVVQAPPPPPRRVVVVETCPPPAVTTVVVTQAREIGAECHTDVHGYAPADYLALLKPSELALLRQRARGVYDTDLTAYLTEREKTNLRARAARQVEIGA